MSYRSGLKRIEAERKLFLAVPLDIYETEFQREGVVNAIADYDVHLVIFDPANERIVQWKV